MWWCKSIDAEIDVSGILQFVSKKLSDKIIGTVILNIKINCISYLTIVPV